jgi:hypothetical protein
MTLNVYTRNNRTSEHTKQNWQKYEEKYKNPNILRETIHLDSL